MNQTIEITCRLLAMFILAPNPTSNWNYNPDRLVPSLLLLADTDGRGRLIRHLREEDDGKERKRNTFSFPSPLALPLTELCSLIFIGD